MAAVKALQQWCKIQCEGYRDVSITNMTTSFRDGLGFCALIHKHRSDLIDFDSLSKENIYENNKLAFEVAEKELGIPALLDAEDMVALKVPDRLSILTYVSQYYNYFHGRSPIGGLAGIKRPAEESNEAPSEKKNQPVTAKVFPSPKPATENKTPKPANENKTEVLVERANKTTLSSSCNVCNQHVHLVQRHLVDGKLYHRNCFKCKECSTILLSGTYKPGKEAGTFICKTHTSIEKPVTVPTTHITVTSPKTPSTFISKTDQNALGDTGKAGLTPNTSKLSWLANKRDRAPTRELTVTPTPAVRLTRAPKTTPAPEATTVKTSFSPRTPTESLKPVSNSVQKNQETRKRFFEPSSIVPASKSTSSYTSTISVSTANVKTPTPESTAPRVTAGAAAGKGRVLLRVGDWTKTQDTEKEKENEKEKAKAVIGKMVTVENNNNNSYLSQAGLKANNSNVSPVESGAKGHSGKVCLKAPDTSVEPTAPAAAASSLIKDKTLNKTSRPASTLSSNSKENDTAPSDWRSMLKPVKTVGSTENTSSPSKKPEAASSPQTSGPGISQTSVPAPSTTNISISINSPKAPSLSPMKNRPKSSDSSSGSIVSPVSSSETETHKLHKPDYIPKEDIQKELKEIEMNMNELEKRGVELEKQLRQCDEEGEEDTLMNDLMVDWFTLIRNKQVYMRRESELVYIAKTQDLEEEQPSVEAELRKLMDKPAHLKTSWDHKREEELMAKLVGIVNDRNAIVEGLDEDRLREDEEDEQLNKMMQNLDMKKEKVKRKSISRWFSLKSKRASTED
ncbi:protein-methionine sulfoxide oxidase mical2b isoform X1 [Sinocyclocheilus grahami]|uniref:protein-methionine sulfoxide oxidase mical2b isoform X1 n=1 Tax=Sinocyclocheilus grahami TaxID=75366 RepID=UPI0007ACF048|nr:PREDICTED: MICAL-like protein 2 isoform X1 [Sinocyclocheilus grahami]